MTTGPVTVRRGDAEAVVDVRADGSVSVQDTGAVCRVTAAGPGEYLVETETIRRTVFAAGAETDRWVFVDGRTIRVEVTRGAPARERRPSSRHDALSAPMPAAVRRILVKPGDAVAKGQTLLLLEAMKMELAVKAPRDGRVAAVRCHEGDLVQPDQKLIDMD